MTLDERIGVHESSSEKKKKGRKKLQSTKNQVSLEDDSLEMTLARVTIN